MGFRSAVVATLRVASTAFRAAVAGAIELVKERGLELRAASAFYIFYVDYEFLQHQRVNTFTGPFDINIWCFAEPFSSLTFLPKT